MSVRKSAGGRDWGGLGPAPRQGQPPAGYRAMFAGRARALREGRVARAAADPAAVSGVLDQPVLRIQIEFSHEVVAVAVHGAGAENQPFGDLLVGVSVGDQSQDLFLARR